MTAGIEALIGIGRNTRALEAAVTFHRDALGFRLDALQPLAPAWPAPFGPAARPTRHARLALGRQTLELTEFPAAHPYPGHVPCRDTRFQHFAAVVDDIDTAYARVMQHGATPVTRGGPQTLPPSTGSVTAFKFRDPDGHPLELIRFPPGTGDPGWQSAAAPGPVLGIDHSAIVVSDVERSLRFYMSLGLEVTERGVNHGPQQQRLDDLDAVEVDVVALQPPGARTPHLELLGYRRPRPQVHRCHDPTAVASDRLVWRVRGLKELLHVLGSAGFDTAGLVHGDPAGTIATWLRDPDGHLSVLYEPGCSDRAHLSG